MAKRLNPKRRRAMIQHKARHELALTFDDSTLLQQGVVRSSLAPRVRLVGYHAPKSVMGPAKIGKIVDGKFKLAPGRARSPNPKDVTPEERVMIDAFLKSRV